ncbi:MAG: hypothetical protein IK015_10365 [Treponema sp.]|nr:hypothetical protein [Treponema sp.]
MKKLVLTAFISVLLLGSLFAQGKNYVIDLADTTNGKVVTISKNQYGPNYQNTNPPTFTKFFSGNLPQPGDTIEVHFKLVSNVDLPTLQMMVIDNSEAAKWWTPISNENQAVEDIKANVPFEGVLQFKVATKPVSAVSVQLMYDDPIRSKITLQKTSAKTGVK